MNIFKQGDTTTVMMEVTPDIGDGMSLKVGIYNMAGKPLFETSWPSDGLIEKLDDGVYGLRLHHDVTNKFNGVTTLRITIYYPDGSFVNAGETAMQLTWSPEPVNQNLK